jgi:ech hydrogenase subunit F
MLDFIPVVLKNVFSKPATRNYPSVSRAPYDKQRGHIRIDIDNCIFCGMCGRKCPAAAITVTRAQRSWSIDRFQCVMCGSCSESCPKKCLHIDAEYTAPANVKSVDTFVGKPVTVEAPKSPSAAELQPPSGKLQPVSKTADVNQVPSQQQNTRASSEMAGSRNA